MNPQLTFFIILNFILVSLFVLVCGHLTGCGVIEMAPRRLNDDGYSALKEEIMDGVIYKDASIIILEADSLMLKEIIQDKQTEIYLWATWCAPCISDIKYNFEKKFGSRSKDIYFITTNYDIENIRKLLSEKVDTVYVLSSTEYSNNEMEKLAKLSSQLSMEKMPGIPQHLYFSIGRRVLKNY